MSKFSGQFTTARKRLVSVSLAGIGVGVALLTYGAGLLYVLLAAYGTAAILYVASVLLDVLRLNAAQTAGHALRENPGRTTVDAFLLAASVASLVAVGILVFKASNETGSGRIGDTIFALISVIISWGVVHTLFLLRYARLYYGDPEGGVDFNQTAKPRYIDFAYLAFTIGMTFQVSDTVIKSQEIRANVLKQALLSYVFGTVIIASTINVIVGLSS